MSLVTFDVYLHNKNINVIQDFWGFQGSEVNILGCVSV
jgi:hypothetical protein